MFILKLALHLCKWHNVSQPIEILDWVFTSTTFKVITLSQILFSWPNSINKHYPWHKHMSFTILVLRLLVHFLTLLFVVFIVVVLCQISYLFVPCLDYISQVPPLPPNLSNFFLVCDFALVASNPSKFLHYYFCAPCNMVTFHALGHSDLTIMVDD